MSEQKGPSWRALIRAWGERVADRQCAEVRVLVMSLAGAALFVAAGAADDVAMLAGLGIALLWLGPRIVSAPHTATAHDHRSWMIAGAAALALACGVQTVVWRLELSTRATQSLTGMALFVLLGLCILIEVVRGLARRLRRYAAGRTKH